MSLAQRGDIRGILPRNIAAVMGATASAIICESLTLIRRQLVTSGGKAWTE
jgi:hypothetical protein